MIKILVIEDDQVFTRILINFLTKNGFDVEAGESVKSSLTLLDTKSFNAVLLDYRLPDGTGMDVLQYLKLKNINIPIIVMTRVSDITTVIRIMKAGAVEYLTKPVNPDELLMTLKNIFATNKAPTLNIPSFVKGNSEVSKTLYSHINLVGPTELSVIIEGESGTGKEHLARELHQLSKRKTAPLVAIDCGALSNELAGSELFGHTKGAFTGAVSDKKGLFEVARGGTLFLDEVGNLSYEIQVQLLRVLQEKEISPVGSTKKVKVDVRVISATNEDLIEKVNNGEFRQDLYHRLNEFKI
ncbi:MAG: sigma-54-dependent transcriptional regulator, partial [Cytophagaceae bacterium]